MSRSFRRATLALVAAAILVPGLTGCIGNPLESLVEGATGGNVELGGSSVPEGFPTEVPLYEGEIVYGIAIGDDTAKAYNVTVRVPDATAADQIRTQLEGAGFTLLGGSDPSSGSGAAYDGANWGVAVVVTEDGSNGWVANYTVTPKDTSGTQ
ncbi:MAG TPA: hypothetical protein VIL55_13980 [Naasia sp.]